MIDTLGHDPRSLYVEMFLLPTLGPTTLLLARHLAQRFDREPEGFPLDLMETSLALGLGPREGANSPVARALVRLAQFDLARAQGAAAARPPGDARRRLTTRPAAVWQVRQAFPPVNRRHLKRLPPSLQSTLSSWTAVHLADAARQRARRVAFVLLETGEAPDLVERALLRAGFSPSLCHEATAWAAARHDERPRRGRRRRRRPPTTRARDGEDAGVPALPVAAPALRPGGRPSRANTGHGIAPRVPPPPRRSPVGR